VGDAIAAHGGGRYEHSVIEFNFRGEQFVVRRDGGAFAYERSYRDSLGTVQEVLDNDGVTREANARPADWPRPSTRWSTLLCCPTAWTTRRCRSVTSARLR